MKLKKEIYDKLCFIKNNKYNLSSRKLSNIDILLLNNILIHTAFLDNYNPQLSCRIKYIFYDMNIINKCNNCNNDILEPTKKFCSAKCNNNSQCTKNKMREKYNKLSDLEKENRNTKRKNTFNKLYGGYTLQSDILSKKMKKTMIDIYGVEHPFKNNKIKQKAINTWIKKYGVQNPFQNYLIKIKIKDVLMAKYGVNSSALINIDERINKGILTKIKNGWIIPDEFLTDYQIYRKSVRNLTEKNYKIYKNNINPENLNRVTNGIDGYQLDHKYSILEGFLNNIKYDIIAHPYNLQMIHWKDNRNKSKYSSITIEELNDKITYPLSN